MAQRRQQQLEAPVTGTEVVRELMEEALEAALETEQPSTLTQLAQVGDCTSARSATLKLGQLALMGSWKLCKLLQQRAIRLAGVPAAVGPEPHPAGLFNGVRALTSTSC